jgi:hypothetical protein
MTYLYLWLVIFSSVFSSVLAWNVAENLFGLWRKKRWEKKHLICEVCGNPSKCVSMSMTELGPKIMRFCEQCGKESVEMHNAEQARRDSQDGLDGAEF